MFLLIIISFFVERKRFTKYVRDELEVAQESYIAEINEELGAAKLLESDV